MLYDYAEFLLGDVIGDLNRINNDFQRNCVHESRNNVFAIILIGIYIREGFEISCKMSSTDTASVN